MRSSDYFSHPATLDSSLFFSNPRKLGQPPLFPIPCFCPPPPSPPPYPPTVSILNLFAFQRNKRRNSDSLSFMQLSCQLRSAQEPSCGVRALRSGSFARARHFGNFLASVPFLESSSSHSSFSLLSSSAPRGKVKGSRRLAFAKLYGRKLEPACAASRGRC